MYIYAMLTIDKSLETLFSRRGWYKNSGINGSTARVYKKRFTEHRLEMETRIKILEACGYKIVQEMMWENGKEEERIKADLIRKLHDEKAFWSYSKSSISPIPDELLIEKVLLHLDIDSVGSLFRMFPKKMIRKIWKDKMLPQEPSYNQLNRLYAFMYFDIRNQDRYIREFKNKKYRSIQCKD
jgi:hypothetical protein